jgi:hypothetical protein
MVQMHGGVSAHIPQTRCVISHRGARFYHLATRYRVVRDLEQPEGKLLMISNGLKRAMLIVTVAISASSAFANESTREQRMHPTGTIDAQHPRNRDARTEAHPARNQAVPMTATESFAEEDNRTAFAPSGHGVSGW